VAPVQREAFVLASASPRRREILAQLGLHFRVIESGVHEGPPDGRTAAQYAEALAGQKADAVAARLALEGNGAFVLGADTVVVVGAAILGKPSDDADAVRMLLVLQGRVHEVVTAVALRRAGSELSHTLSVRTRVEFRAFDEAAARRYVDSGEGRDKAGSYAAQGFGAGLVRGFEGSYSNVVGLPAVETIELLLAHGVIEAWP
jgi:septum formation protein